MRGEIENKFKKNIMQKNWKKNKKGLTLVETVLAIAVLSITIMASTAVSSSYLRSRMSIKKYQANNEELSLALNYLAKDIRMSSTNVSTANEDTSEIKLINNTSKNEVIYKFNNNSSKTLTRKEGAGPDSPVIVASNVEGKFYVSNNFYTKKNIPKITITIKKIGTPEMVVQTTVSMRANYVDSL
jgi:type II secretory pathway component PulJ